MGLKIRNALFSALAGERRCSARLDGPPLPPRFNVGCCTLFVVQTGALGVNESVLNGQSTVSVSVYFKSAVANAD